MQQAGSGLQQAQQQLAQAGQEGQQGAGAMAMAGKDGFGANGMPNGSNGAGKGGRTPGPGHAVGPEAGHGTTNQKGEQGGEMQPRMPRDRQSSDRSRMTEKFQSIYAPERIASNRIDTQVTGKQGEGKRGSDYQQVRGAPDPSSASRPYYEVYSSYRRAAEEAIGKEDVPAGYRKQVRDYFDSLQPSSGQ